MNRNCCVWTEYIATHPPTHTTIFQTNKKNFIFFFLNGLMPTGRPPFSFISKVNIYIFSLSIPPLSSSPTAGAQEKCFPPPFFWSDILKVQFFQLSYMYIYLTSFIHISFLFGWPVISFSMRFCLFCGQKVSGGRVETFCVLARGCDATSSGVAHHSTMTEEGYYIPRSQLNLWRFLFIYFFSPFLCGRISSYLSHQSTCTYTVRKWFKKGRPRRLCSLFNRTI